MLTGNTIRMMVVADPASVHAARFVKAMKDFGHEVEVFHAFRPEGLFVDEHLKDVRIHVTHPLMSHLDQKSASMLVTELGDFQDLLTRLLPRTLAKPLQARLHRWMNYSHLDRLRSAIERFQPEVILSHRLQPEGYLVAEYIARSSSAEQIPWIHYSWGSDFRLFGEDPSLKLEHEARIRNAMRTCQFIISDCLQDQEEARKWGFGGKFLGSFIANLGYDLARESTLTPPSKRNVILVKGRQESVGQAFRILKALRKLSRELSAFEVRILMPSQAVKNAVHYLNEFEPTVNFKLLPRLDYQDLLEEFSKARVTVSASKVDGLPAFLAESMVFGALPIHSKMNSVEEQVTDGLNGLLFKLDDERELVEAIQRGISDDVFVDSAAVVNRKLSIERFDKKTNVRLVTEQIRTVLRKS